MGIDHFLQIIFVQYFLDIIYERIYKIGLGFHPGDFSNHFLIFRESLSLKMGFKCGDIFSDYSRNPPSIGFEKKFLDFFQFSLLKSQEPLSFFLFAAFPFFFLSSAFLFLLPLTLHLIPLLRDFF